MSEDKRIAFLVEQLNRRIEFSNHYLEQLTQHFLETVINSSAELVAKWKQQLTAAAEREWLFYYIRSYQADQVEIIQRLRIHLATEDEEMRQTLEEDRTWALTEDFPKLLRQDVNCGTEHLHDHSSLETIAEGYEETLQYRENYFRRLYDRKMAYDTAVTNDLEDGSPYTFRDWMI